MSEKSELRLVGGIIAVSLIILGMIALRFEGTGDDGDSVHHYLFARWAMIHHNNFFNHWAKPIYVILTVPFALINFTAVKFFNIILFGLSQFFSYKIAQKLGIKNAWLVPVFLILTPMNLYLTPAALTEPLWAFWCILGIYLAVNQQFTYSILWISFLPMVRSEGLIILCVFAIYVIIQKRFWALPMLLFGQVVFMFLGAPFHDGNLLWVFNKVPYATLQGVYGSGTWVHFIDGLRSVMGGMMRLFFVIGLVYGIYRIVQFWRKKTSFSKEEIWLVYGCGMAYFVGHTAFWAMGLFNSFGLLRVMIAIMPIFAIITTRGFNVVCGFSYERLPQLRWLVFAILIGLIAHSSYRNLSLEKFTLTKNQICINQVINDLGLKNTNKLIYLDSPSVGYYLENDYFSDTLHRYTNRFFEDKNIPKDALIIWDSWFSPTEAGTTLEKLQNDPRLTLVGKYGNEPNEEKPLICVFKINK